MNSSTILDARALGPENVIINSSPSRSLFVAQYARLYPYGAESVEVPVLGQTGWNSTMWVSLGKRGDLLGRFYWAFITPGIRHKSEKVHLRPVRKFAGWASCGIEERRFRKRCDDDSSFSRCSTRSDSSSSDCPPSSSSSSRCKKSKSCSSSSSSRSSGSSCHTDSTRDCSTRTFDETSTGPDCSDSFTERRRCDIRKRRRCLPRKWVHWVNAAAHVFFSRCEWIIGNYTVDTHYGEWCELWDRLTLPAGQSTDEIVGRYADQYDLWCASRKTQIRYAKMRFSFCEWMSHALPVMTIYWSSIQSKLYTRPLHECWISSDDSTPELIDCDRCVCDGDLKVKCWVTNYWVSLKEQKEIDNASHEYLITQNQLDRHQVGPRTCGTDATISLQINLHHTITEIMWTIQDLRHINNKDWFTYSGVNGGDPLVTFALRVSNGERVQEREGRWFRTIEPNEHHTRTPDLCLYSLAFCSEPERTDTPTGSLNWSSVDNVVADMRLQEGLGACEVKFWGRSFNLLRIRKHTAGTAFRMGLHNTSFRRA